MLYKDSLSNNGFAILGLCAAGFTAWWAIRPICKAQMLGIPGSWGIPGIGNLLSIMKHDLTHWVDGLCKRTKGPVAQMWLGGIPNIIIIDPDLGRRVLSKFTRRSDLADGLAIFFGEDRITWRRGLLFSHGPKWRVARKAFEATLMHPKGLARHAPFIAIAAERTVERLGKYAESGQPIDVLPIMYDYTMDVVGWAAFGLDLKGTCSDNTVSIDSIKYEDKWWDKYPLDRPDFSRRVLRSAVTVMRSMDIANTSAYIPMLMMFRAWFYLIRFIAWLLPDSKMIKTTQAYHGLTSALKVIVNHCREQLNKPDSSPSDQVVSSNGFIARLVQGKDMSAGETLTDLEIVANAFTMVTGGYETTGTTICNMLYMLSKYPDAQAKLQQEIDVAMQGKVVQPEDLEQLPYLDAVFKEVLRLLPAGSAASRVATEDFDTGLGFKIKEGLPLYVPVYSYNRDPTIWPRPEEFLPERHLPQNAKELGLQKSNAFLPFGYGSRNCVGFKLAEMEGRLAVARLLQRFTFHLVPGVPAPKWRTSLTYTPDKVVLSIKKRQ